MTEIINNLADYIIYSAAIPILIFVFRYTTRSPFERTREGITALFKQVSLALLILVIVGSLIFGQYPGREYVRLVIYTAVVVFFWVDLVQLLIIQKKYPFHRFGKKRPKK